MVNTCLNLIKRIGFSFAEIVPDFCTKKCVKPLLYAFLGLILTSESIALAKGSNLVIAQNSNSAQVSGSSKNSVKKKIAQKKEKQDAVISKNLSPAEQQRLTSQKWSFILGTYATRSLDEMSDYGGTLSGSMSYKPSKKLLLTSSLAYEYLVYKNGGSFLVTKDDPRQYGISDLRLGFSMPRVLNLPELKSFVNFSGGVNLPTSITSREATQYFSASLTASMISFLSPKFLLNSYGSILAAAHEYDEVNVTGTGVNSPFGLRIGASLSYNIIQSLTSFVSYDVNPRYEYANGFRNIQSFSAGLQYALTDKAYLSGSFFWRDQFITNDVVFDDDKSFYSVGIDFIL